MTILRKGIAVLTAATMLCAVPAHASPGGEAEKLRRLDIMLMVTSLRCRTTQDNFQSDFAAFEAAHLTDLNNAALELRRGLVAANGVAGANRALDRISTGMANQYGQGHPRLGCAELKQATRLLAQMKGRDALLAGADELLDAGDAPSFAMARR